MKKKRTFLLLGVMIITLMGWVFTKSASGTGNCQIPNTNEEYCRDYPDDAVTSCNSIEPGDGGLGCRAAGARFVYTINSFPEGTVPSDAGHTKQISEPCWARFLCDYCELVGRCVAHTAPADGWHPKSKYVVKDNEPCE
ncbi:MAG: hypothetical protein IJH68_08460 [Thermoguttaceae bacterium]|nr:hypothetical protein [Thermoguttaceae bacterium]